MMVVRNLRRLLEAEQARLRVTSQVATVRGILLLLVALFAFLGLVALMGALFVVLAEAYGVATAALVIAAIAFLVAALLLLIALTFGRERRRLAEEVARMARENALEDLQSARKLVSVLTGRGAGGASLLALVAMVLGLLLGIKPRGKS